MASAPSSIGSGALGLIAVLAVGSAAGGCGSRQPAASSAVDASSGTPEAATGGGMDGGVGADEQDAPAPPLAYVRIAHASPDAPAIDVCVAPHGTTAFVGPLFGQLAASLAPAEAGAEPDAAPIGVAYSQVSAYLPLDVATFDVRIVAAGATSCASSLGASPAVVESDGGEDAGADALVADAEAQEAGTFPGVADATNLPTLATGASATLLVTGDLSPAGADPGLTVTLLPDDVALTSGAAILRAINAVPSQPALDFGLVSYGDSGVEWVAILADVRFGASSSQVGPNGGAVDANGYTVIEPLVAQAMGARVPSADGGADVASASGIEIDQGSIATLFAIGGKTGDADNPPALLLCIDNQPPGGLLSDCSVQP